MNEEIMRNEIGEEELEQVSGGAYTECNRGYSCQNCGSDNIRVFDVEGKVGYLCFSCGRGGPLNT